MESMGGWVVQGLVSGHRWEDLGRIAGGPWVMAADVSDLCWYEDARLSSFVGAPAVQGAGAPWGLCWPWRVGSFGRAAWLTGSWVRAAGGGWRVAKSATHSGELSRRPRRCGQSQPSCLRLELRRQRTPAWLQGGGNRPSLGVQSIRGREPLLEPLEGPVLGSLGRRWRRYAVTAPPARSCGRTSEPGGGRKASHLPGDLAVDEVPDLPAVAGSLARRADLGRPCR